MSMRKRRRQVARDTNKTVMGVAWYRRDQWDRLLRISSDFCEPFNEYKERTKIRKLHPEWSEVEISDELERQERAQESGDDVMISGFGGFCVKEKAKRRGRNPATGKDLILAPRKVVTFKWSAKLKEKLNIKPKTKAKKRRVKSIKKY